MPGYRRVMENGSERPRRRSADIRPLLLRAAASEFAEKGYASAKILDIAERAEVAPSVLYRHFSGKGDMFKDAVVSPLLDALEEYRIEWASQRARPYPDEQIWLVFIDDLYRSFSKHRHALAAYVSAADQLDPSVVAEIQHALDLLFQEIIAIGVEEAERRSLRTSHEDIELILHLVVTMVAGATTLGPLTLQLSDGPVDPARLVKGMSALTLWGMGMTRPTRAGRNSAERTG